MPTGIIFGLIALLGWGLSNSLAPAIIKKVGPIPTLFLRYLWETIIFIPFFLYFYSTFNFNWSYFGITLILALVGYIPVVTFYSALKTGKIGVVAPVADSSIIITVLLSLIFFNEKLSPSQILAIVLIVGGILLMSVNFADFKSSEIFNKSSGIVLALVTCLLWGVVFAFFKIPVSVLGPILTAIILEVATGAYAGLHLLTRPQGFKFKWDKNLLVITFLMGLFGAGAITAYNYGIQNSNVSLVVPIALSNPMIAALYGKLIYKEKLRPQQWLAALLIVAGIIFICR